MLTCLTHYRPNSQHTARQNTAAVRNSDLVVNLYMSSSTSYFQRASTPVLLYLIRETFMLFSYLRVSWSCCVQVVGLWSPSTGGKRNEKVSFLVLHVPYTLSHILHTVSTNGKFQWVTPKQTVFKDSTESLNTGCRLAKIDIMYFVFKGHFKMTKKYA